MIVIYITKNSFIRKGTDGFERFVSQMMFINPRETKLMQTLFPSHKNLTPQVVVDTFIQHFYDGLVRESDKRLLDLAFKSDLSQEELDRFLSDFDIECLGGEKSLLLSYVMKMHPNLKFNAYTGPRLEGLLRFYRFKNLELIAHYTKIGKALNAAGIKPLLLKGGVMKYLRPELSRTMGDIDILIQTPKEYDKALQIITDLGYVYVDMKHSVDLHEPGKDAGVVDIHRYLELIVKYNHRFLQRFFKRAKLEKVWGVDTWLPCPEDLLFIDIVNLAKNLRQRTSKHGILYTLFDFEFLQKMKPDFDWNIVVENIKATGCEQHLYTTIKFVNKIIPGLLPESLLDNAHMKRKIRDVCNQNIFYLFHAYDLRIECKNLHFKDAIKSWAVFKHYISAESRNFFIKRIGKSPMLINLFFKIVH